MKLQLRKNAGALLHHVGVEPAAPWDFFFFFTFFEQARVDEEDEEAAERRSGQSPGHSEELHPGAGASASAAERSETAARRAETRSKLSSRTRADSFSVGTEEHSSC